MKKLPITFLLLFCSFCLTAQKTSVNGTIVARTDEEKLSYVNVTLMKSSDSTLVKGALTGSDGEFSFTGLDYGNYWLRVFFVGYENWYSEHFTLSKENPTKSFGTITISPAAVLLEGANIVAEKPLLEMRHGTLTMNVEANPTAAGDNVIELLKKMPGVIVDHNDNISVEGRSGVTILIDDKPTYLSGDDLVGYLKSMPAGMIDKIEVNRNPSARYDAQGSGGVINIVTKKEQKFGINGSVFAGIGYAKNLKTSDGFNLTARTGKWTFSGNYSYYGHRASDGYQATESFIQNGDTIIRKANENDDEFWCADSYYHGHNFSFGTDYFIDKKNVISLLYRGSANLSRYTNDSHIRNYTQNTIDSLYVTRSNYRGHSQNHIVNLNYKHSFDSTGKDLHLDILFSHNERKNSTLSDIQYYYGNFQERYGSERRESTTDPSKTDIFTVKLDYEHPFNENVKLETGLKSSWVMNDNKDIMFKDDVIMPELENHFIYNENINALYAILYATVSEKLDIQVGLRGEHTYWKGNLVSTKEINSQNYFNLFPNVSIEYKLPKNNNLGLSYRYSISRPGYHNLNPFIDVSNPYAWQTGNPNLKPQYTHSIYLNYSWNYKIFIWGGYDYTIDSYTDMIFFDNQTGIAVYRPENIGKSHFGSLGISARFTPWKWWAMNYYIGANIGQEQFNYKDIATKKLVYSNWFYFNETFTFLKNYAFEISGYGSLPAEYTFGKAPARFFINAGFKATFLKDKNLTINISFNDIFNNGFWKMDDIYPDGSSMSYEYRWESRIVWLAISYRFGKQDIQARQRNISHDELDRVGGGGNKNSGGGGQQ